MNDTKTTTTPAPVAGSEPLPCPFCGGKAHLDKSYGKIRIECGGCGAKVTRDTIDAERRAIDAWNSRATPASGPLSGGKGE